MSQQLGSEVERQGKANKSATPRTALSFQRKEEELPWVGFEPLTLKQVNYSAQRKEEELPWVHSTFSSVTNFSNTFRVEN